MAGQQPISSVRSGVRTAPAPCLLWARASVRILLNCWGPVARGWVRNCAKHQFVATRLGTGRFTNGVLTRTVRDTAAVLDVIAQVRQARCGPRPAHQPGAGRPIATGHWQLPRGCCPNGKATGDGVGPHTDYLWRYAMTCSWSAQPKPSSGGRSTRPGVHPSTSSLTKPRSIRRRSARTRLEASARQPASTTW